MVHYGFIMGSWPSLLEDIYARVAPALREAVEKAVEACAAVTSSCLPHGLHSLPARS